MDSVVKLFHHFSRGLPTVLQHLFEGLDCNAVHALIALTGFLALAVDVIRRFKALEFLILVTGLRDVFDVVAKTERRSILMLVSNEMRGHGTEGARVSGMLCAHSLWLLGKFHEAVGEAK